jgi:glutathione S-transferase
MGLSLYAHPFSSYCQKVLIALYENATPFEFHMLSPDEPQNGASFAEAWPLRKMPLLMDGGVPVREASIIIEHLHQFHPGPVKFIPDAPKHALEVRFMDRVFDNYVMTPMQHIVADFIREKESRDPLAVTNACDLLDRAYAWLDGVMKTREWAAGDDFSLADCAAAPSLFYADWVREIGGEFSHLRAYRARLLARPSMARAVDEARPFRRLFPPGAPDRD